MNYIYIYSGNLPSYAKISINSIKSVDLKANIVLCSDEDNHLPNVKNVTFEQIESELTKKVKEINYFQDETNPLWTTSLLRIFYLLDVVKFFDYDNFIHFDADVMIYKSYDQLKDYFDYEKFNITSLTELDLIFSYSFTKNIENYQLICEKIYQILKKPKKYEKKFYESKKLNEMMLLNIVYMENRELFNILPSIPDVNNKNKILFDSGTYGQYLSGASKTLLSKNIIHENSFVGRFLLEGSASVKFKNKPFVRFNKENFELANLHIHGKNLNKYIPKGF